MTASQPEKRRGGRPRSPNKRTAHIMVRVTPAEKQLLLERAGARGAARYMRALALGPRPRVPRQIPELNQAAWIELAATTGDVKQHPAAPNRNSPLTTDKPSVANESVHNC